MQDTSQVYKDQLLTNVFLGYKQQGFVAEEILPTLNVPDLTGVAFQLDETHLRAPAPGLSERTGFARANRINLNLSQVPYGPLREHSLEIGVTDLLRRVYRNNVLTPEINATNAVSGQLLIEKEVAVRDQLTTAANFPSSNKVTLSGTSQFDNAASDPVALATTARRAVKLGCGNDANVVIMNPDVRDALRNNAAVKARIQYASKLTRDELDAQIADLLGVERIIVASAVTTTQVEGSTTAGTKSYIWSDDMLFAYVTPAPALETLSLGYLLRLDPANEVPNETGRPVFVGVDKWYEQSRKSTFIRANDFYLPWTVASTAGYLVKDTLSTF